MIGHKIKALRKQFGLTQAQLGERLGLAESTISLYEANKRSPDYDTLLKITNFFNITTDNILDRDTHYAVFEEKPLQVSEASFCTDYNLLDQIKKCYGNNAAELVDILSGLDEGEQGQVLGFAKSFRKNNVETG